MTPIALATAIERAREAALTGDASTFADHLRGIQALDRDGHAPSQQLHLLAIVAAARCADVGEVDRLLDRAGHLPASEWDRARRWLVGAPEMQLPAYVDFVRSLDRRMRNQVKIPAQRRHTPAIAMILAGSLASLAVLAWRLSPADAADSTRRAIESVLSANATALLEELPSNWRGELAVSGSALATHDTAASWKATEASIDALSKALLGASKAPTAVRIAERLIGPRADAAALERAAKGVGEWRACPWIRVSKWSDPDALAWTPSDDAAFAWRCALRHMPLGVWMPGWFSPSWQCEPLRIDPVAVTRSTSDGTRGTLLVLVGTRDWATPVALEGRRWPSTGVSQRWRELQPALAAERCTAAQAALMQQSMADQVSAVAAWIDRMASGQESPAPPAQEVPWWVP
jgi:hypothetical protein